MDLKCKRATDRRFILWFVFSVPLFFPGVFLGQLPAALAPGLSDTYVFFEPYTLALYHSLLRLENPFWDHLTAFGAPVLLTLGGGSLHPFHFAHLFLPDPLAFVLGAWARFAFFGTFSYLYLRQCKVNPWIAAAAVTSLVYGSFFLNYANDIIGYVLAFFPFCLYCIERINQRLSLGPLIGLSLGICALILGGFLSVIMYLLLTLAVYTLVHSRSIKNLFWIALFGCAGVMLTLPALIEIFNFFPQSGFDPARRRELFFYTPPIATAYNLVFPSQFGDILQYRANGQRDFYGTLLGAGILTLVISGLASLLHPFLRRSWPKRGIFWLALLFFCLSAYFNVGGIKSALSHLPLINQHPLTRLQTLIAMAGSFSSALFLNQWMQAKVPNRMRWIFSIGAATILLAIIGSYGITQGHTRYTLVFSGLALLSLACLLPVVWGQAKGPKIWLVCVSFTGVISAQVYTHYLPYDGYYPDSPAKSIVKGHLLPGARVLDIANSLFDQTSHAYSVPAITNHWFTPEPLRQIVRQLSDAPVNKALTFETLPTLSPDSAWPILRQLHVQIVTLPTSQHRQWLEKGGQDDWRLLFSDPQSNLSVLEVLSKDTDIDTIGLSGAGYQNYREGGGSISLRPKGTGANHSITIPVRMYAGWTIVSGASQLEADAKGLIKITPDGSGTLIELRYFPPHFWAALLFGIGLLFASVALFCRFHPPHDQARHAES